MEADPIGYRHAPVAWPGFWNSGAHRHCRVKKKILRQAKKVGKFFADFIVFSSIMQPTCQLPQMSQRFARISRPVPARIGGPVLCVLLHDRHSGIDELGGFPLPTSQTIRGEQLA